MSKMERQRFMLLILSITILNINAEDNDGYVYDKGFKIALLPLNCSKVTQISHNDVICPPRRNELDTSQLRTTDKVIVGCRPKNKADDHIPGKICRVTTWRTTCTETWYFTTTIDYSIVEDTPGDVQCITEYERLKTGLPDVPYYPPSICYWNAQNTVSVQFVTISDHPTLQDPYNKDVIDPIFDENRCRPRVEYNEYVFCDTRRDKIKWFTHKTQFTSDHCQSENWDCQAIKQSSGVDIDHNNYNKIHETEIWESPDIGRIGVYDSCYMKFCDKLGIRLVTGEWYYIKNQNNQSIHHIAHKECPPNSTIGVRNHIDRTLFEELDVKLEFEHSQCIQTLIKLRNKENISPLELGYLSPSNEGTFYAYLVEYKKIPKIICSTGIQNATNGPKCKDSRYRYEEMGYVFDQPQLSIKRAKCEYRSIVINGGSSMDGGYALEKDHRISYAKNRQKFNILDFYDENKTEHYYKYGTKDHQYNLTWNGILVSNRITNYGRNHTIYKKFYLTSFSALDSLIPTVQSAKLEVSTINIDRVKRLYIDEQNQVWHLEDHDVLKRVDVVETIEDGVGKVIHTVTGWFSGAGKMIQWFLWGVGLLVVIWILVKIHFYRKRRKPILTDSNPLYKFFNRKQIEPIRDVEQNEVELVEPSKPRSDAKMKQHYSDDGIYEDVNFRY
ncbi:virion transmembrane glycoprotein [Porcine ephemerovirus 1]|uniref:Virion transmembrane glycoprotein n=1 Tax=Porcine ephemerovirus 1 TaxID=2928256 RepID=A0AAX3A727_9RHAB|nr:virion transmembrane glycoprotein [Porcine ephemerovirus 1]UNP42110.1 virion transmembrane glycoprotein [Porcine ephemerovirus 1]